MAIVRGTALAGLVEGDLVKLTGRQDLANLEADAELDLADMLVTASDWVYDRLTKAGVDPSLVTNEEVYKRAVATYVVAQLVDGDYLGDDQDAEVLFVRADKQFEEVRAELSEGPEPRTAGEGVPSLGNVDRRPLVGNPSYWDRPTRR